MNEITRKEMLEQLDNCAIRLGYVSYSVYPEKKPDKEVIEDYTHYILSKSVDKSQQIVGEDGGPYYIVDAGDSHNRQIKVGDLPKKPVLISNGSRLWWEDENLPEPNDGEDEIESENSKPKLKGSIEYINTNAEYYKKDVDLDDKPDQLTIGDMNKPIGELSKEQLDKIWNATKGVCGG